MHADLVVGGRFPDLELSGPAWRARPPLDTGRWLSSGRVVLSWLLVTEVRMPVAALTALQDELAVNYCRLAA